MFGRRRRKQQDPAEARQPRERKPREERLFPRMFRFISTVGVEAVVTRFLGPAGKTPMGAGKKLGILAVLAAGGLAIWKGCG